MKERNRLAHRYASIPHSYFFDKDLDDHVAPVDYAAATAGTVFIVALISGSLAVICVAAVLIAKCIRKTISFFA